MQIETGAIFIYKRTGSLQLKPHDELQFYYYLQPVKSISFRHACKKIDEKKKYVIDDGQKAQFISTWK